MILSIYQPTRVTHSSVTLIGNIYINSQLTFYSYILPDDLSDHFPCLVSCEMPFKTNLAEARPIVLSQMQFSENIYLKLNQETMLHDWTLLCHMVGNTSYNYLISYCEELLDMYAPYEANVIKPTKKNSVNI